MPEFVRHTWASNKAKEIWEPRLRAIHKLSLDLAVLSVLEGYGSCSVRAVAGWQLFQLYSDLPAHGLTVEQLSCERPLDHWYFDNPLRRQYHRPIYNNVVVGTAEDIARFQHSWTSGDYSEVDAHLGYPPCCREFHHELASQQMIDPTWSVAANTRPQDDTALVCNIAASPLGNFLWRWIGVRLLPYIPCRFDCEAGRKHAEALLNLGRKAGFQTETKDLVELLSSPVEWTGLHGIAEIKTPILKMTADTDATAEKYTVRWQGSSYPKEGAKGLAFPYRRDTHLPLTESPAFRRNLRDE